MTMELIEIGTPEWDGLVSEYGAIALTRRRAAWAVADLALRVAPMSESRKGVVTERLNRFLDDLASRHDEDDLPSFQTLKQGRIAAMAVPPGEFRELVTVYAAGFLASVSPAERIEILTELRAAINGRIPGEKVRAAVLELRRKNTIERKNRSRQLPKHIEMTPEEEAAAADPEERAEVYEAALRRKRDKAAYDDRKIPVMKAFSHLQNGELKLAAKHQDHHWAADIWITEREHELFNEQIRVAREWLDAIEARVAQCEVLPDVDPLASEDADSALAEWSKESTDA